jgi:hypothetical protein
MGDYEFMQPRYPCCMRLPVQALPTSWPVVDSRSGDGQTKRVSRHRSLVRAQPVARAIVAQLDRALLKARTTPMTQARGE